MGYLIVEICSISNAHQKSRKKVIPTLRDILPLFHFSENLNETSQNYVYQCLLKHRF